MDDIPLFPVAQLTIATVPKLGVVIIRPDFLTHMTQQPEQAQQGRSYALTPVQARYLAEQILAAVAKLESGPGPGPTGPTH